MKKILLCLLIIFVMGCIPIQEIAEEQGEDEGVVERAEEPEVKPETNLYTLRLGDRVKLAEKTLTVLNFNPDYEITIDVSGEELIIYSTRNPEVINGLEVTCIERKFDPTGANTYIVLKVVEFKLGADEYIFYHGEEQVVLGDKVKLLDVYTDSLNSLLIRIGKEDARINKGETAELSGFKITNINTNPRMVTSEKYAIVKIEKVTF